MTLRYLRTLLATALLLAAALTARAQTANTWTGQADASWNNPANWSLARVPGACHDVVIPAGVPRYPTLQGDVYIQTLELGDDARLYTNDFDIYLEVALPFSVLAQGGVMACAPGAVLPLTARVSGGDTATYTYTWTGPAGDTLGRNAGAYPDTLTVNTPQAGVKADSANTVVFFRAGFAVNAGADYTAVVTGFSSNPARQVATQAGVYTLTVTDPLTGCSLSDTARVGYTAGPQLTLAHATDSLSCLRDSIRLLATVSPAGTPVQWSGPGLSGTAADSVYARAAGTYTATATASGCTVTESVTVVRDIAQPVITLPATDTLPCAAPLVLRPVVTPARATLRWTGPGIAEPATADTLVVTTAGTYLLTVTHPTSGCVDTASVQVVANADCAPPADTSCFVFIKTVDAGNKETARLPRGMGSSVWGTLTLSTEDLDSAGYWNNGVTRSWLLPDSSTVTASTLTASQVGLYTVTLIKQGLSCEARLILTGTSCHAGDTTYACNPNATLPVIADDPAHYLQNLTPGDTIFAGDFIAIVLQVDGGSAATGWTGLAKVKMPYLGGTELAATFTNAKINDCYELVSGSRIETAFDPNANGIADVDGLIQAVQTTIPEIKRWVQSYKGSIEDKENAGEFKSTIEKQIESVQNDPSYTNEEKTAILANLNKQLDGVTYLQQSGDQTCQSPLDTLTGTTNGRLAALSGATDVCSALSEIYQGAKAIENFVAERKFKRFNIVIRTYLPYNYVHNPLNNEYVIGPYGYNRVKINEIDLANVRDYPQYRNVGKHGSFKTQQKFVLDFENNQFNYNSTPEYYRIPETVVLNLSTNSSSIIFNDRNSDENSGIISFKMDQSGIRYFQFRAKVAAENPAVFGSPSIDYDIVLKVYENGLYSINGFWDGFPALEIFMEDTSTGNVDLIYENRSGVFDARKTTILPENILFLYPWKGDVNVKQTGIFGRKPHVDRTTPYADVKLMEQKFRYNFIDYE